MPETAYETPLPLRVESGTKTVLELLSTRETSYCYRHSWYTESHLLLGTYTAMDVFVDLNKRKAVNLSPKFLELFGPHCTQPSFTYSALDPVAPLGTDHKMQYPITERDLDKNEHVNFSVFIYLAAMAVKLVWQRCHGNRTICKIKDLHISFFGEFTIMDPIIYVYINQKGSDFHISFCDANFKQKLYMKACVTVYDEKKLKTNI